ncbi:MAG: FAD-binding domain-containing protein [Bacteroidota bacterium]
MYFPTDIQSIKERISKIDPVGYGITRNYLDGKVTYLSPYISRGVISTKQLAEYVMQLNYQPHQLLRLVQELAWRDYFQRVWLSLGDDIFDDIRMNRGAIRTHKIPKAILEATTGIDAVDEGIKKMLQTGYMHNHLRMYVASITCNIGKSDWRIPSQWMYYHLLDGDLASNTLSWQWVAGTFSSKKYYCNQENINQYCGTKQKGTFLDKPYLDLPLLDVPRALEDIENPTLSTELPQKENPVLDPNLPVLLYHPYHLDPEWKKDYSANRILVLEPSHFREHPVSKTVLQFIIELGKNIEGLQVFAGEVGEIPGLRDCKSIYTREHPSFHHFPGIQEQREWMVPELTGRFNSFFDFWKKAEKALFPKAPKAATPPTLFSAAPALSLQKR